MILPRTCELPFVSVTYQSMVAGCSMAFDAFRMLHLDNSEGGLLHVYIMYAM